MKKTRRIGFVIHSLNAGGAERVLTELANELVTKQEVVIITLIKCVPFYSVNPKIKIAHCSNGEVYSKNGVQAILNNLKYVRKIYSIIKDEKINLIIGFTTSANVMSVLASKTAKIKCIISERNNPILAPPNKFWTVLRNFTYRYANYLVVQTENNKSFYSQILPKDKIIIIANPIGSIFETERKLPRFDKIKKSIISVGRLNSNKSQDLLIKAFANIPNDEYNLKILGDGPKKDNYIELTKDLSIENKVEFLGNINDISKYYNNATIFVFTSKSEGFPNALMEAMYFGLPCISTNCPNGPSDLIQDGINGFLIEVDNRHQLEEKLTHLMNHENIRQELSRNAILSTKKFEMKFIVKAWEKYINELT